MPQAIPNRVQPTAGTAQNGSTTGVDTGDVIELICRPGDDPYIWLPKTAGVNYCQNSIGITPIGPTDVVAFEYDYQAATGPGTEGVYVLGGNCGGVYISASYFLMFSYDPGFTSSVARTSPMPAELSATSATGIRRQLRVVLVPDGVGSMTGHLYWRPYTGKPLSDGTGWTHIDTDTWPHAGGTWKYANSTDWYPASVIAIEQKVYDFRSITGAVAHGVDLRDPSTIAIGTTSDNRHWARLVNRSQWAYSGAGSIVLAPPEATPTFSGTSGDFFLLVAGLWYAYPATTTYPPLWSTENSGIPAQRGVQFGDPGAENKLGLYIWGDSGGAYVAHPGTAAMATGEKFVAGFRKQGNSVSTWRHGYPESGFVSIAAVGTIPHNRPGIGGHPVAPGQRATIFDCVWGARCPSPTEMAEMSQALYDGTYR